jgi:hypothetical protein
LFPLLEAFVFLRQVDLQLIFNVALKSYYYHGGVIWDFRVKSKML